MSLPVFNPNLTVDAINSQFRCVPFDSGIIDDSSLSEYELRLWTQGQKHTLAKPVLYQPVTEHDSMINRTESSLRSLLAHALETNCQS